MLGNIISAGASLLGGLMSSKNAKETRDQQLQLAERNIAEQRDFAQHGLTWKINDALANADKVHPIYSLGSAGASFSPVSANFSTDTSMGNAVAAAGQDIGRAVNSTATSGQRADAFTKAAQAIQLEKGTLENELLKTQLASQQGRLRQVSAPAFPATTDQHLVPGQAQSGPVTAFKDKPEDRVPSAPGLPQQEGGAIPDVGYARTKDGWAPVPSKNVKERIEDMHVNELMWMYRNNILPTLGMRDPPPNTLLKSGQVWRYDPLRQEYYIKNKPTRSSGW